METFAVARSVFFHSIYNGSLFRTFRYIGRDVSRHVLNVTQHLKELFATIVFLITEIIQLLPACSLPRECVYRVIP
jgi:hypothetical protein